MHIFISYAKQDTRELALDLDYELGQLLGVTAWVDRELTPGHGWAKQIEREIRRCDLVIVLISPDVNREPNDQSDYSFVLNEIAYAKHYRKEILPVIAQSADIPIEIVNLEYIDLEADFEAGLNRLIQYIRVRAGTAKLEEAEKQRQIDEVRLKQEAEEKARARQAEAERIQQEQEAERRRQTEAEQLQHKTESVPLPASQLTEVLENIPPEIQPAKASLRRLTLHKLSLNRRSLIYIGLFIGVVLIAGGIIWAIFLRDTGTKLNGRTGFIGQDGKAYFTNDDWKVEEKIVDGVTMVLVPTGCFSMGSDDGGIDERPVRTICIEEAFWLDKYEVTNADYDSIGCISYSSQLNQPRNCVSWFDAQDFCTAHGGRLPTEAEWEFAARGPESWVYPWGNDFIADNVVYESNSHQTATVGSKPAGASWVGAMDMSGNVWEWTSTINKDYPYDVNDGREDIDNTNSTRVLRGGSFLFTPNTVTATFRWGASPTDESYDFGFRCVRSIH